MAEEPRYRIAAVHRALMLLNAVADSPGSSASQLAERLKANRSLTFRMLRTLEDSGFVIKGSSGGYRLGPQVLYLGQRAEASGALTSQSAKSLDQLHEETHEDIMLCVRERTELKLLAARRSTQSVRVAADVGTTGGLHTGGAAKVLLAYAPKEIQEAVVQQHLHEFVPPTLRSRSAVIKVLQKIRDDGYYVAVNEIAENVSSISAPIHDASGNVIAVVTLLGPTHRIGARAERRLLQHVKDAAAEISRRIIWTEGVVQ